MVFAVKSDAFGARRHEDLYFTDGNIVIVAEGMCFRVHSSQLTRHSDVFRGMMDIPQPLNAVTIDGCPIVELHDSAEELVHLLTALYDGLYFTEGSPIEFPVFSAILHLSNKYFCACLRQRAIARLRLDWPLTLVEWDAREQAATTSEGLYNPALTRTNPILIINLARKLALSSFLPAAFYDLSRYTPSQILGGSPDMPGLPKQTLDTADLVRVFQGKEAGQRFMSEFIARELEDRGSAPWCRNTHEIYNGICRDAFGLVMFETLRAEVGLTAGRQSDPLFMLQRVTEMQKRETGSDVAEKVTARGCEMCRADLRAATERARRAMWESIPEWFQIDVTAAEEDI